MIFNWKTEVHRYRRYLADLTKLSRRKEIRSFGELTLSLITISFFAFFAIRPTLIIIARLVREIKDKEEIQAKFQKKISDLLQAQEIYSTNQNRFYLIDQALPLNPDFTSLIFPIEKEALNSGITITSFSIPKIEIIRSPQEKLAKNEALDFQFSLTATGNYPNLQDFLARIDKLRRILDFKTINLEEDKLTKAEVQTITLTISGTSKFFTAPAQESKLENTKISYSDKEPQ